MVHGQVLPDDPHNRTLVSNVHPPDWQNPTPDGRYNLVVIGAGSGGLITSLVASSLGAKVALVERHLLGGDCLNVGCVPSKAVIREARRVAEARSAADLGLPVPADWLPDFGEAMRRMRERRAHISAEDSARRYTDEFGVEIFLGNAKFTSDSTIDVDGTEIRFKKAVIASGARPAAPAIDGLDQVGFVTNETVFELTERPRRLAVIGGGPIGCELAQAFRNLGSEVTLFQDREHVLNREDPDAAEIVQNALIRDGVELVLRCAISKVDRRGSEKVIRYSCAGGSLTEVVFDEILVALGRAPNVEGMGLETAGVEYDDRRGVHVDDHLRTSNRRIFAVGDVCMSWKFTHASDAAAKIVVQNALFFGRKKLSALTMPWCTYTHPEIAHVGIYGHEAKEKGIEVDTYQLPLERVNRAVTDDQTDGFVKVHVKKGTDKILGATIVAANAGDLISEITTAMVGKLGLGTFTNVIHPYPTQADAIRATAGLYTRTRLTPFVKRLFTAFLEFSR